MSYGLNRYSEKERHKLRREYKYKRDRGERKIKTPHKKDKWSYSEDQQND